MSYETYGWEEGVELSAEPRSSNVDEAKSTLTEMCDDLVDTESLSREYRVSDGNAYVVEWYPLGEGICINHFHVFMEGNGLGTHIIEELGRVARAHGLSTISIWIGANEPGTEQFLDSLGFEWEEDGYDEAHGRTLTGERPV